MRIAQFSARHAAILTMYVQPEDLATVVPLQMLGAQFDRLKEPSEFWYERWDQSAKGRPTARPHCGFLHDILLLSESSQSPAAWSAMIGLTHNIALWSDLIRLYLDQIKHHAGYSSEINTSPQAVRWFNYTVRHCRDQLKEHNFRYSRALLQAFCYYLRNTQAHAHESRDLLLDLLEFCVKTEILTAPQVGSVFCVPPSRALRAHTQFGEGWLRRAFDCSTISSEFAADGDRVKDARFADTSQQVRRLLRFPDANDSLFSPKHVPITIKPAQSRENRKRPSAVVDEDWYQDDDDADPELLLLRHDDKKVAFEEEEKDETLPNQEDIQMAYVLALSMKEK